MCKNNEKLENVLGIIGTLLIIAFVIFIMLWMSCPNLFRTAPQYCYIEDNSLKIHYAFGEDLTIVKDSQFDQMVKIAQEHNCNLKVIH